MAILMLTISFIILKILTVKVCLTVCLEGAKVKCKYANRKPICDFVFDDNSNVDLICQFFKDIHDVNECA